MGAVSTSSVAAAAPLLRFSSFCQMCGGRGSVSFRLP